MLDQCRVTTLVLDQKLDLRVETVVTETEPFFQYQLQIVTKPYLFFIFSNAIFVVTKLLKLIFSTDFERNIFPRLSNLVENGVIPDSTPICSEQRWEKVVQIFFWSRLSGFLVQIFFWKLSGPDKIQI